MNETKTPKAGEWWLRNTGRGGRIFFICGFDPDGCPVHWNEDVGFFRSQMRFFCKDFHHEPRCTGFGWVEPAIDPGEGYELLPVGTMLQWYDQVLASGMTGPTWVDTAYFGECVGSRPGLEGPYRRKIKAVEPPAEDPNDMPVAVPGIKRVPVRLWINEEDGWLFASPDQVLASDQEILHDADGFFVEPPAIDPNDMPLNPVPGKVVATGTVTFTPVKPPDDMAAIIAEHTQQVRELTQRIGELCFQVNQRDAMIEQIRTALHQDFSV